MDLAGTKGESEGRGQKKVTSHCLQPSLPQCLIYHNIFMLPLPPLHLFFPYLAMAPLHFQLQLTANLNLQHLAMARSLVVAHQAER